MSIKGLLAASIFFLPSLVWGYGDAEALLADTLIPPLESYRGTLEVSAGSDGRSKTVVVMSSPEGGVRREIVDRFGLPIVTIVSDGETEWIYDHARAIVWKGEPADADLKLLDPDEEMELLLENYTVRDAGVETVAERKCRAIEILTGQESPRLLRRLCVDEESGIVLQRQTFDAKGNESGSVRFLRLEMPASIPQRRFKFQPPADVSVRANRLLPDYMALEEAAAATAMTPRVPRWVPNGFVFESVNLLAYRGTTVLHYRYSDGIDALSVFQAPRGTHLRFPGERPRRLTFDAGDGDLALWSGGKTLTWSAGDRFVVIGRLSVESLRRIADSIPTKDDAKSDVSGGFTEIDGFGEEALP